MAKISNWFMQKKPELLIKKKFSNAPLKYSLNFVVNGLSMKITTVKGDQNYEIFYWTFSRSKITMPMINVKIWNIKNLTAQVLFNILQWGSAAENLNKGTKFKTWPNKQVLKNLKTFNKPIFMETKITWIPNHEQLAF